MALGRSLLVCVGEDALLWDLGLAVEGFAAALEFSLLCQWAKFGIASLVFSSFSDVPSFSEIFIEFWAEGVW